MRVSVKRVRVVGIEPTPKVSKTHMLPLQHTLIQKKRRVLERTSDISPLPLTAAGDFFLVDNARFELATFSLQMSCSTD